jgi:hypothetical protein
MRKFVRSEGYAKARLVTGSLFMILGAVVIVRTLASVGFDGRALPSVVLGGAMLLLGWFRFRDYFATRGSQT